MRRPFDLTVTIAGARVRIVVQGDITVDTAADLLGAITAAVRCDVAGVDVDLEGVTCVDPEALDVLVEGERAARRCESAFGYRCHLRILRPSRPAEVAIWAAGLDGYLDIVEGSDQQPAA